MNKNNDEIVCTTPISLLSILESSAMSQEILINTATVLSLFEKEEAISKMENYKNYLLLYHLYHRQLTEYSTCVHVVSNSLQVEDILQAYNITSILTRVVLNFPKKYFSNIVIDIEKVSNSYFNISKEIVPIFNNALKINNDRAILFFLIAQILSSFQINTYDDEGIEKALFELGVKVDKIFFDEVEQEFQNKLNFLTNCQYPRIEIMAKYGFENFQTLGIFGSSIYDFSKLKLPYIMLGDNTEVPVFNNCFDEISPLKHSEYVWDGEKSINSIFEKYVKQGLI